MRAVVVGLGVQGQKRLQVAGRDVVATVDSVRDGVDYRTLKDVPLDQYDAAFVCVPEAAKIDLLAYLLGQGKHALVEKPLISEDDSELVHLDTLARSQGAVCYTAYNHRFEPHVRRMKELLESGRLGRVYFARLFYGNGTARDVRNSPWRDQGSGVLRDLGSHLLDIVLMWFGPPSAQFHVRAAHRFENRALDHVIVGMEGEPAVEIEATLLSWRNHFSADIYAERGSAHIDSLCKWGPSTLTVRTRVLPSGRPSEEAVVLTEPDPTWDLEYGYFKQLCREAEPGTLGRDVSLNRILRQLSEETLAEARA